MKHTPLEGRLLALAGREAAGGALGPADPRPGRVGERQGDALGFFKL